MVLEPRIRTFQDFREEEEQYPVEEPYSVMVRKPRQRMVPVEREETYKYPVEQEYTVMEPQEKIRTVTKYKTIIDKEPRQEKYTVDVEQTRKRVVIDYVEGKFELETREPYTYTKEIPRVRKEWEYKNITDTVTVDEPVVVYEDANRTSTVKKARVVTRPQQGRVQNLKYLDREYSAIQKVSEQVEKPGTVPYEYTVAVPRLSLIHI